MLDFVDPSASSQDSLASPSAAVGRPQGGVDLGQSSFEERWEAAKQVPRLGEAAIPDLIALLGDEALAWETRWFAARSLGNFDHPTAIAALIDALGTADEDLQDAIIDALGHIGPSAIQSLSALVTEAAYQTLALEVLTRIPHPATQPPLVAAVDLTTGTTQAKVIDALGQFADLDLLPIFTKALQNKASSVRLAALQGLIRLRTQVDEAGWVSWIQPLVQDVNPAVAQRAIHALGRTTDPAATQTLHGLLVVPHTPEPLKIAAAQALAWQGTAAALEGIVQAWEMLSNAARIAALQALSRSTNSALKDHVVAQVSQWLNSLPAIDNHSLLRRHLVLLLGQLGDHQVISILQSLSQDADAGVRLHAQAALHRR